MKKSNLQNVEAKKGTQIMDGRIVAAEIFSEVLSEINVLKAHKVSPCLAIIIVGNDSVAKTHLKRKISACENGGIYHQKIDLAASSSEQDVVDEIDRLNRDDNIHGILIERPLPHHINLERVTQRIDPKKDVDGFHPENVGKLSIGLECLAPCTAAAVPELIIRSGLALSGKHVCILGRSNVVGKPLMNLLINKGKKSNCTVTCCHSGTDHLANFTRQADIVVAAIGVPKFLTAGMIKEGATIVDVGINRVDDPEHSLGYRLVGDVDYQDVFDVAGAITPVPTGISPVVLAMMVKNTLKAAQLNH